MHCPGLKIEGKNTVNKAAKIVCATGLLLLASVGGTASAKPGPGFYYLICRGGGPMNPIIQPLEESTRIIVNFRAAGAGWKKQASLQPGQCTWADRGLSAEEPTSINFDIPADIEETVSWGPNVKAFFFPFQKPVNKNVRRTTLRVAIQVMHEADGFSLKVLRLNATSRSPRQGAQQTGRAYEAITTFDFSGRSYLTFSVKNVDGVFVANRLIKGAVTGDDINVDTGGEVIVAPPPPRPRGR